MGRFPSATGEVLRCRALDVAGRRARPRCRWPSVPGGWKRSAPRTQTPGVDRLSPLVSGSRCAGAPGRANNPGAGDSERANNPGAGDSGRANNPGAGYWAGEQPRCGLLLVRVIRRRPLRGCAWASEQPRCGLFERRDQTCRPPLRARQHAHHHQPGRDAVGHGLRRRCPRRSRPRPTLASRPHPDGPGR